MDVSLTYSNQSTSAMDERRDYGAENVSTLWSPYSLSDSQGDNPLLHYFLNQGGKDRICTIKGTLGHEEDP